MYLYICVCMYLYISRSHFGSSAIMAQDNALSSSRRLKEKQMLPLPVGLLGPGHTWDVDESMLRDMYLCGFIDERPAIGSPDDTFCVKMVQMGSKNDPDMSFTMSGGTSFGQLMCVWCLHRGVPLEKLRFNMDEHGYFDRELKPEECPWGVGLSASGPMATHNDTPIIIRVTPRSPKAVQRPVNENIYLQPPVSDSGLPAKFGRILLTRLCKRSGTIVRHILDRSDSLDIRQEILEYRQAGWQVTCIWRGVKCLSRTR